MPEPLTPFLAVRDAGIRLSGESTDYDALIDMAHDRQYVLLGEATHGTREFYRMRAEATQQLILRHGFDAVAIEGDWPDVWRINRYVHGESKDTAADALGDFQRFPSWMWRNQQVLEFADWLRGHNMQRPRSERVGVYGLDLYSLYRSAEAVIRYLERNAPEQAAAARRHYAALDHVREPMTYGYEAAAGLRLPAQREVIEQLRRLRASEARLIEQGGIEAIDSHFFAEQNAIVVVNAEAYYRESFGRRVNTWNLRDAHMAQTLFSLEAYRRRRGGAGRIVVWAHNSHLGDARATESAAHREWNLGQLVRERVGDRALLVGFTTYTGQVCAASAWDGEAECKRVLPARHDSWEYLFHTTGLDRFFLPLGQSAPSVLHEPLLERAIGVLYLPQMEYASHYFEADIAGQFDALFHLDETAALEPLGESMAANG
ncbi:erythromycin esterase family protein [Ralstonia solanacearum]|uniref:erythromycin esterase family protein n=1 Tax=Ralstonia solanacearum TaxID=305 RepID=UPI002304E907|nr:erythromycin esterase family protein [Ralstonia solanacearum]MDB0509604.1 erythromycin esterase family protein [Ralstonia solanacearum]MDB0515536.1 erythromycin esterase family protein [Ralstonia solanacearum]